MTNPIDPHRITTPEQLAGLYGEVDDNSIKKEIGFVHPHYRALIEASPFAILATCGPGGLDVSPRGDPPGFVVVEDEKTLLLPERRGNNRIDSLRNLLTDPRISLIFLIPGVGETLRVKGTASLTIEPSLLARFEVEGKPPKCVVVIHVESIFYQCARALHRSKLWQPVPGGVRPAVPTAGQIMGALSDPDFDEEKYDRELPARQRATLY
jgi:PPOX class probable FMN-dependent enzyme